MTAQEYFEVYPVESSFYNVSEDRPNGYCIPGYSLSEGRKTFVTFPYLAYGDYLGGTVERSNVEYFEEEFDELFSAGIFSIRNEGFNSRSVVLWPDVEVPEDLALSMGEATEAILALEDYPLMSEDHHSELETTLETEAMPDILEDLKESILSSIDEVQDGDYYYLIEELPDDVWEALYLELMQRTNTYPEFETGCSVYVDVERLAAGFFPALISEVKGNQLALDL